MTDVAAIITISGILASVAIGARRAPATICLPVEAKGPVIGASRPILTTSCAIDGVAAASRLASTAARNAAVQLRIPVMAFPRNGFLMRRCWAETIRLSRSSRHGVARAEPLALCAGGIEVLRRQPALERRLARRPF